MAEIKSRRKPLDDASFCRPKNREATIIAGIPARYSLQRSG